MLSNQTGTALTQEQIVERNTQEHKEASLLAFKIQNRALALDTARSMLQKSGGDILQEAEKIYLWLIKDLIV